MIKLQSTYSFNLLSSRLLVAVLRCFDDRLLVCVLLELVLLSSASLSVLSFCNALLLLYVSRITININDTPLTESQIPRRYACKMLYVFILSPEPNAHTSQNPK